MDPAGLGHALDTKTTFVPQDSFEDRQVPEPELDAFKPSIQPETSEGT